MSYNTTALNLKKISKLKAETIAVIMEALKVPPDTLTVIDAMSNFSSDLPKESLSEPEKTTKIPSISLEERFANFYKKFLSELHEYENNEDLDYLFTS